jgi:hypothetical protein
VWRFQDLNNVAVDWYRSMESIHFLLIDGIGLALILSCTILEGVELWHDYFYEYIQENIVPVSFFITGRVCQVLGLLLLIIHAAMFQLFIDIERCGMILLTVGPIINIVACSTFDPLIDPLFVYNRQWLSSEVLELIGILILDLSMIDSYDYLVLIFEVLGFFILGCAALLDFQYSSDSTAYPLIMLRSDLLHISDCFGLFLLTIVAIFHYRLKINNKLLEIIDNKKSKSSLLNVSSPQKGNNIISALQKV